MSIASIICFSVFIVLIFSLTKKKSDILSPGRITLLIWSFAIGLTDLKLSRFQYQWSIYSWIILILSILSLLLGIYIVYVMNFEKKLKSVQYLRNIFKADSIDSSKLFQFTLLFFITYFISYIVSYLEEGVIPLFSPDPGAVRTTWGIFGFGLFIQTAPVVIYFSLLSLFLIKRKIRQKIILVLILMITFVSYFFLLQRFYLLFGILLFGIFIYYSTNKFNFKNLVIFFVLVVGLLYEVSTIRTSSWAVNLLYYLSKMRYSVNYAIFTEPYMYIAMNLENFANAVNHLNNFSYGYFTFDFILALSGLKHWLVEYSNIQKAPFLITSTYNTYTMFFTYYRDFGVIGIGVIPFLIGAIISHLYYRMRLNPNINTISIYGIFIMVIIFSFFIPILSWLVYIFNLVIIYLVTKIVIKKSLDSLIKN